MYYEEKTIDGKVYIRTTPDGEWRLKPVDQAALIRELVGALEGALGFVRYVEDEIKEELHAGKRARAALSRVPEEYK